MTKYSTILLLLVVALTNAYISNIALDVQNGQVYVTENNILYELDDVSVEQNAVHYIPGPVEWNAFHVGKHRNKRVLYAYMDYPNTEKLAFFPLPLRNQETLKVQKATAIPPGLSNPSVFDDADRFAVLSVSRYLTSVDLNTLKDLDSMYYYQNRQFGVNLVYNHQNKHLLVFSTYFPIGSKDYGLTVDEFDVSNGSFIELDGTYNCQCGEGYDDSKSPFYHVEFAEGNCNIDYSSNPARIWCPYPEKKQLFSFNAANLSDFNIVHTTAKFDAVAWDFTNKFAYAIFANENDYTTQSFKVSKVSLSDGSVASSYTNNQHIIDATVFQIDVDASHLYLSAYSDDPNAPTQLISVNINNLDGSNPAKVVTLNTNGL